MQPRMNLRPDLQTISDWITDGARVLDLGCGNGALLCHLKQRGISGYGLELDNAKFVDCIKSRINVIQADLNNGLPQFSDHSFDFVILSQTLQAVNRPDFLLSEIVRVGRESVIGFPNFGHWQCRFQLACGGHMPVSKSLPNSWFGTPNIHFCTVHDFEKLCADMHINVLNRRIVNHIYKDTLATKLLPNLFGQIALYKVQAQ